MARTEEAKYKISLLDRVFNRGMDRALGKSSKLDQEMSKVNRTARGSGSTLSALGKTAIFAGLITGAATFGSWLVKNGAQMEQNRIAFQTMVGDVEKGNKVFADLAEFANVTPFQTKGVQKAGRTLLSFGVQTEELLPTLKVLGDISAGTGKDLSELGVIYGQIKGAGKLMGQDLLQLINAGFNPLQQISERTGKSMGELKDEMSNGLISFADVQQAFIDATSEGGRFQNLMEKQSKSLEGLWSTLTGKIQAGLAGMAEKGTGALGRIVQGAIDVVDFFSTEWNNLTAVFQPLIDLSNEMASEFSELFGTMGEGLTVTSVLKSIFNGIGNVIRFLMPLIRSVANSFMTVFRVIKEVSFAIVEWYQQSERAQEIFKTVTSGIVAGFVTIREFANNILSGVGDLLVGIFSADMDRIKKGLSGLKNSFAEAGKSGAQAFEESYNSEAKNFFEKEGKKKEALTFGNLEDFIKDSPSSGGKGSDSASKKASSSVSGVASGRPTNINIDIEKLIETFNVNTSNLEDMEIKIKNMVSKALVSAVNDANLIAN